MSNKYFLPSDEGPGFNSTPDIIKSFWVTLDMTNRYDNIMKDCIREFVVNLFLKDTFPPPHLRSSRGHLPPGEAYLGLIRPTQ